MVIFLIIQISYSFFPFGSDSSMELSLSGTKVPRIFRSQERKFHGTFVPGSECSIEFSLPGVKVPWNFRSRERKFLLPICNIPQPMAAIPDSSRYLATRSARCSAVTTSTATISKSKLYKQLYAVKQISV